MKYALLAILLVAFNASATNPPNECGNHGNNCQPGDTSGNSSSSSSSNAGAVGVGVGVGLGGDGGNSTANANGGAGGAGGNGYGGSAVGLGGAGGHSSSAVKDSGNSHNLNANNAQGGDAKAYGGSANQGQQQGQQQSNVGVNSQSSRNDNTNVSGSKSIAQMASENTANLKNHVNASSQNANNSQASGNTTVTNVGGDSTMVERNAPPVFLGNLSATMSCSGGFNAGASDRNGSGAFGFTWISGDCRSVVMGREFLSIGMPDVSCRIWKTTKGYKRAVKADPSLADVDCTAKPSPAAVVAPAPVLVAPELAPRIPRG